MPTFDRKDDFILSGILTGIVEDGTRYSFTFREGSAVRTVSMRKANASVVITADGITLVEGAAIRRAFYVDETMATDGGYIPCVIVEGDPHMTPMLGNGSGARPWIWGPTLADAKQSAREWNEDHGLTDVDVSEIMAAARAASLTPDTHDRIIERAISGEATTSHDPGEPFGDSGSFVFRAVTESPDGAPDEDLGSVIELATRADREAWRRQRQGWDDDRSDDERDEDMDNRAEAARTDGYGNTYPDDISRPES